MRKRDKPERTGPSLFGYSPFRRVWMDAHRLAVALYTALPPSSDRDGFVDDDRHFGADPVVIEIRRGQRVIWIDFTSLTEEELTMFRDVLNTGIDAALPVCRYIDQAAQEATEAGHTFSPRPFRVRPVKHMRWDEKVTIPDNYKEYLSEQNRSSEDPPDLPEVAG